MTRLRKRVSRKTGEPLHVVDPTAEEMVDQRGNCELTEEFLRGFLSQVQSLAKYYIDLFFVDVAMHCGGEIGEDLRYCPEYVSMVMNYDIGRSVDVAYGSLGEPETEPDEEMQQSFVITILERCARLGVPKCFAGGLLLMYMELGLGISLRQSLAKYGRAA